MPRDSHRRRTTSERFVRVLFLSNGDSARSPIAKSILLWLSRGEAVVASAGVAPLKEIHPMARAAVRRVFNGHIADGCPKSFAVGEETQFDYIFTLSQEAADHCPSFANNPTRVHWAFEDPAVVPGSRDHRQAAFDRMTRDLLRRLRRWWLCRDTTRPNAAPPPSQPQRRHISHARWRTHPDGDAPILAVAFFGPPRSCTNMCALFERSGFQVLCGEKYGRISDVLPVVPHAIVVRVDGACHSADELRSEFHAVQALRRAFADIPVLMLVDHVPSDREQEILKDNGVTCFRRLPQRRGQLLKAIDELVGRRLTNKSVPSSSPL
jgi:arsenate reductase (thioredoxin)